MKRRSVFSTVLSIVGCILLGACGGGQQINSYGNDGVMGLSNTNPNLPANPAYHTYQGDARMIHKALKAVPGIKQTKVRFHGANAYVDIRVSPEMDAFEKQSIQEQAQRAVSDMMPRYQINVAVN